MTFPVDTSSRRDVFDLQWTRTVAPTAPTITVSDLKDHARITQSNGDSTLRSYIDAATDAAEQYMNRGLVTQTWALTLRWFADVIWLPMAAPLQSVTTVKYYDTTGVLQTLAATEYEVDTVSRPGRILRGANKSWPALQSGKLGGRVVITYVVGWTDPALVPERIKQGIRMYVAAMDCDREGAAVPAASEACWNDRVYLIEPTQTCYGYSLCPV
jgi:uncharacterized phiE125 gp8 family phage protein